MECELENITVYYEIFGQGRPIIMLHGWPADHRQAVDALESVFMQRDGWKRIYLDLPGMGRTHGADWITGSDQMLEVTTKFIDHVIPGQRFALAGISYGGYLARGLVHRRASLINGALFIVPVIVPDGAKRIKPEHIVLVRDQSFVADLAHFDSSIAQGLLDVIVVQDRRLLDDQWVRTYISEATSIADENFLARVAENYTLNFDLDTLSEPCSAPMLFLLGGQDSLGYPKSLSFLENYPRASFVILDRAGHGLWLEQATLYHALVNEWLNRVEEWIISSNYPPAN
jgi:pimeloyl-ACP methyl ester carboxylesterase